MTGSAPRRPGTARRARGRRTAGGRRRRPRLRSARRAASPTPGRPNRPARQSGSLHVVGRAHSQARFLPDADGIVNRMAQSAGNHPNRLRPCSRRSVGRRPESQDLTISLFLGRYQGGISKVHRAVDMFGHPIGCVLQPRAMPPLWRVTAFSPRRAVPGRRGVTEAGRRHRAVRQRAGVIFHSHPIGRNPSRPATRRDEWLAASVL